MSNRRMGDFKLTDSTKPINVSKQNKDIDEPSPQLINSSNSASTEAAVTPVENPVAKEEKHVTVNIKITRSQQEWLADTARQVRANNISPVPPSERVYPQHLIGVAIELLQATDVDWESIRNIEDLKKQLKV